MFVRVKKIAAGQRSYQYVQIVENRREAGQVRQRIVASLGRLDRLEAEGDLQRIIEGLVKLAPQVRLVKAQREGSLAAQSDRLWGPVLIFERLWQELGLHELMREIAGSHRLEFDLERCAFAIVLQRLIAPGSDLQGSQWVRSVEAEGFDKLQLAHFYKTVGLLWRHKERIETHLYRRGLDLFNQEVDLVFFDTTSTYFEGMSLEGWAKRGMSRDHRPDHLQLILGVIMRRDGIPISCEIWPGNKADVTTLIPIMKDLKRRFRIRQAILVCDRGMVSAANLKALSDAGFQYIVGMRMRRALEVKHDVLGRAGRYREVQHNLHVKEVWVDERRYVVCLNPERAEKDRADRQAILAKLETKLKSGAKALIPNTGYRRFLKSSKGAVEIDHERVKQDERYDGKYVLRTTTDLTATEVAQAYRQLTWIERLWRELKDVMQVRPIYHHLKKDNVKGHIFGAFLALYLSAMLRRRLDDNWRAEHPDQAKDLPAPGQQPARYHVAWDSLMRDLSALRAIRVQLDGELHLLRTEFRGNANDAFQAVGLRPPPLAQKLAV
jgi:hypothetical protein